MEHIRTDKLLVPPSSVLPITNPRPASIAIPMPPSSPPPRRQDSLWRQQYAQTGMVNPSLTPNAHGVSPSQHTTPLAMQLSPSRAGPAFPHVLSFQRPPLAQNANTSMTTVFAIHRGEVPPPGEPALTNLSNRSQISTVPSLSGVPRSTDRLRPRRYFSQHQTTHAPQSTNPSASVYHSDGAISSTRRAGNRAAVHPESYISHDRWG